MKKKTEIEEMARIQCNICGTPQYCEEYNGKPCSKAVKVATALVKAGYRKQEDTVKEFANIVISECEHLQEHCEEMSNNDAYDYVEILIAEINRQTEQYGKEEK